MDLKKLSKIIRVLNHSLQAVRLSTELIEGTKPKVKKVVPKKLKEIENGN